MDILAAQREARSVVDGAIAGDGAQSWCAEAGPSECRQTVALTTGDQPESTTTGEAAAGESKRLNKPRVVGLSVLEYSLIVILVAIVVIVVLGTVGHQAQDLFSNLSRGLAT